jgi:hypothetical protein
VLTRWEKKVAVMEGDRTFAANPGRHCQWCAYAKSKGGPCIFG